MSPTSNVRRIFVRYVAGAISAEEAIEELSIRTTSLHRDLLLMFAGVAIGAWAGAALVYLAKG